MRKIFINIYMTNFSAASSSASFSSGFPHPKMSKTNAPTLARKNGAVFTRAMAKELHFNKDGSTMKKLQVHIPSFASKEGYT